MNDKDELILYQSEYISLLERECENAFGLLFKFGHKASPESIVLGKKYRGLIAETKAKIDEKGKEDRKTN